MPANPTRYFPVAPDGFVLVDADGRPASVARDQLTAVLEGRRPVSVAPDTSQDLAGARVSRDELDQLAAAAGLRAVDGRIFGSDRAVSRLIALLRHRDLFVHDPADGSPLTFDERGVVASGVATRQLFPRIDPAVIGLVRLAGTDRVLLARNRRARFYSLIAGYVDPGETLEAAFVREVMEETGRRAQDVTYWGSQPWAVTGSLMIGFTAVTEDEDAVGQLDGELADIRWVTREDVHRLSLPGPGSIAHQMLTEWRNA
ncbi:NAD(+) diphosphatase [Corynebacterium guangdongense]|uniref:NAD(+) diphosphatase n=1 Tax=Corynebacterium guangdongense TaxID=1783348 RepID=A0ABU1ZWH5_9CORY|nr:NAD(+) diphosphatase [Corynebacterium guangdongense]MDR7328723.1 NAD+ diphosphatase [Corynebacterium guangdongense]WJZ17300.1 NADH pyrophosphatase [Corynebacterium guangdongense]